MSSKHRLTRSFRTLSVITYLANTVVALHFAAHAPFSYIHFLDGTLTAVACLTMLCVATETPTIITERLERSKLGEVLFTFRGRYVIDVLISLHLFAMAAWGFLCAVATLSLIFGIRFLGVKQPDAFNEIFRQSDVESQGDSYTMESEYDTPVVERR
ncbi:hypothetical protein FisN_8Lh310 [Fistulifera solaris]|uniref:Uncharacterized protein n=1 Tax=Fistulifera solaris TaxID=1519565 RepID=A0A1Z5JN32_FISSO|nr:hypothetical protein FisN_8Lh310 [Fistulifera solaris]|eukprot:GAX15394.1 hypothetical protein FisN_8Lh310 [Fistulifera solaris]